MPEDREYDIYNEDDGIVGTLNFSKIDTGYKCCLYDPTRDGTKLSPSVRLPLDFFGKSAWSNLIVDLVCGTCSLDKLYIQLNVANVKKELEEDPWYTSRLPDDYGKKDNVSMTDWGRALLLISKNRETIKYSHIMSTWYIWNGKIWEPDSSGRIYQLAKSAIRDLYTTVLPDITDPEEKKRFFKAIIRAENQHSLKSMVESATNEPGIPADVDTFDQHKDLLNVKNGVIDLQTGKLFDHERGLFMTKMLSCNYDKNAECPQWLDFLNTTFAGDEVMIAFIKRFLGYSLTGHTREQVFCIFYGHGGNGKGVLIDTLSAIMEEYAKTTDPDTVIKKKYERSSSNDLADLWGARFVSTSETDSYQVLDEGRIKRITGQDPIKCRFLYKELFEYLPEYKLVLLTNHEPIIKAQDYSIWRRVLKVPFVVQIPREEWNVELRSELLTEREGILAWLVEGAVEWYESGLAVPEVVSKATEEYKEELDVIGDFLDACTEPTKGFVTSNKDLYECYKQWCAGTTNKPFTSPTFSRSLIERGLENVKTNGVRGKCGISIKPDIIYLINNDMFGKSVKKLSDVSMIVTDNDNDMKTDSGDTLESTDPTDPKKPLCRTAGSVNQDFRKVPREVVFYRDFPKNDRPPSTPSTDNGAKKNNRPRYRNQPSSEENESTATENIKQRSNKNDNVTPFFEVDQNYLVRKIVEHKNSYYQSGHVTNIKLFAAQVKHLHNELNNVSYETIEELTRKLSNSGWC